MADLPSFGWAAAEQNLVTPHLEYLRKNRWILDFAGLPTRLNTSAADAAMSLRLNCSKAARPKISFEDTEVKRLNGSVYLAGKPKFEMLAVTFYDSITDDPGDGEAQGVPSASDIIEQWRELIYQPNAGDAYGAVGNYKGFAYLHMLGPVPLTADPLGEAVTFGVQGGADPATAIVQSWIYQGLYPQSIEYGETDYGSSDVQEVTVQFRYDRAFRVAKKSAITA